MSEPVKKIDWRFHRQVQYGVIIVSCVASYALWDDLYFYNKIIFGVAIMLSVFNLFVCNLAIKLEEEDERD